MKNPIKTLEPNLSGRDFVIGDLHGSYTAFERLLKEISFDPKADRMISVGDLVDRGPESLKCLSLLHEPWFHAVLANHEQMMLEKFKGGWQGAYWYNNGGTWGMEAYNDYAAIRNGTAVGAASRIPYDASLKLLDLLPLTEELPFIITVTTRRGKKYHVIHAELPNIDFPITDTDLADPIVLMSLATVQRNNGDAFLWSRNIFDPFHTCDLSDRDKIVRTIKYHKVKVFNDSLSHIISGHTIVQRPLTIVGQTNIDTGAYSSYWVPIQPYASGGVKPKKWAALTCIELDTWKFYQATETTFTETVPLEVTRDDL
jgi:hypothetical protein